MAGDAVQDHENWVPGMLPVMGKCSHLLTSNGTNLNAKIFIFVLSVPKIVTIVSRKTGLCRGRDGSDDPRMYINGIGKDSWSLQHTKAGSKIDLRT
jgi:hypothetical protein